MTPPNESREERRAMPPSSSSYVSSSTTCRFDTTSSIDSSSASDIASTSGVVVGPVDVPAAAADIPSTSGAAVGTVDVLVAAADIPSTSGAVVPVPAINNRVQVSRQVPLTALLFDGSAIPAVNVRNQARQQLGDGGAALARELSRGRRRANDGGPSRAQGQAHAARVRQRMESLLQFSLFRTQVYQLRFGLLPSHAMLPSPSSSYAGVANNNNSSYAGSSTTSRVDTSSSVDSSSSFDSTWSESMWSPEDPSESDQDIGEKDVDADADADAGVDADADSAQYYEPRYGPKRSRKD